MGYWSVVRKEIFWYWVGSILYIMVWWESWLGSVCFEMGVMVWGVSYEVDIFVWC